MIVVIDGEKHVVFQLGQTLEEVRREVFMLTLEHNHGNIVRTAKALGICVRTARNWVRSGEADGWIGDYWNGKEEDS